MAFIATRLSALCVSESLPFSEDTGHWTQSPCEIQDDPIPRPSDQSHLQRPFLSIRPLSTFWGLGLDLSSAATIQSGTSPNARDRGGRVSPHCQASAPAFATAASATWDPGHVRVGMADVGGSSESRRRLACPAGARPTVAMSTGCMDRQGPGPHRAEGPHSWGGAQPRGAWLRGARPGGHRAGGAHGWGSRPRGHGRGVHADESVTRGALPGPSAAGHSSLRPQVWARAPGRWPPGPGPARRGTGPARLPHRQKAPSAPPPPLPRRGSAELQRPRDPCKPGSELTAKVGASPAAESGGSRARGWPPWPRAPTLQLHTWELC